MAFHHESGPGDAHAIQSWVYDTLAKRNSHEPSEGSTDPITAEDVALHRICWVKVPAGFWILTNLSPIVWSPLGTALPSNLSRGEQLVYVDTANKVIGPLGSPPVVNEVAMLPLDGLPSEYGVDFTVRHVVGGSAPGYYICIALTSTPPGGGSFGTGSNPSVGLEGLLESGDKVQLIYPTYPAP